MVEVPEGGYSDKELPGSLECDKLYTKVLNRLQKAWETGDQSHLMGADGAMAFLSQQAVQLIKTPLPSGKGNYGPSFRLISG